MSRTWLALHLPSMTHPWLDIKLYLTPRLRGFAWDALPLTELLATSGLLATSLEVLAMHWRPARVARLVVAWLLAILLLLAVSRQHSMQWRRLHPQVINKLSKLAPHLSPLFCPSFG